MFDFDVDPAAGSVSPDWAYDRLEWSHFGFGVEGAPSTEEATETPDRVGGSLPFGGNVLFSISVFGPSVSPGDSVSSI